MIGINTAGINRFEAKPKLVKTMAPVLPGYVSEQRVRPAPAARHLCPLCGRPVTISAVNVSRCTNVGGAWRTSLVCSNVACRFADLSEKSLDEWKAR